MKTHDYSVRTWGHDYVYKPLDEKGLTADMMGWGCGIEAGDYLIIRSGQGGTTRYQVASIEYYANPNDMWNAKVTFAPRTYPLPE